MRHVHAMIVEAEVPNTPQIIDHYNELVAYLRTQSGAIWTNTPMASVRFSTGIEVASNTYSIQSIYLYYDQTTPFPRREQICSRIMKLYTPIGLIGNGTSEARKESQVSICTLKKNAKKYNNRFYNEVKKK